MSADGILRERARALAEPLVETAGTSAEWLVVALGGTRLALPSQRVTSVLEPGPTARVPSHGESSVIGVRGDATGMLLSVADPAGLLRLAPARPVDHQVVVVLDDAAPLGLLVDEVIGIEDIGVLADVDDVAGIVVGIAGGGELAIDVDAILAAPAFGGRPDDAEERESTKGSS